VADHAGSVVRASDVSTSAAGTKFTLIDHEDGSWGIEAAAAGKLLCAQATGELVVSQPLHSGAECVQYRLQPTVDGSWAIQSYVTKGWLEAAVDGTLTATAADPRGLPDDSGRFEIQALRVATL
jgi:hypothetical protein